VVSGGAPATTLRSILDQHEALFPKGALHMRVSDDHD
jgi:hypothetical protein